MYRPGLHLLMLGKNRDEEIEQPYTLMLLYGRGMGEPGQPADAAVVARAP